MDQPALSLKLFKRYRNNKKNRSLFRQRMRLRQSWDKSGQQQEKNLFLSGQRMRFRKRKLQNEGQILIESVFFIMLICAFLAAVQFFEHLARREIQKERLTKQKLYKPKKAPWLRPTQDRE